MSAIILTRELKQAIEQLVLQLYKETQKQDKTGFLAEKIATRIIKKLSPAEITKAIEEFQKEEED